MTGADDLEQVAPVWLDAVLRENVARALSHNSDADRSDYDHFRGYWLSAADAALHAAGLAEVLAERDRARDVAVALEQELAGYDARVHAALKQIIRTVGPPDAQEKVEFVLADWQDPAVPVPNRVADPFTVHLIGPVHPGTEIVYAKCCGLRIYERAQHVTYEPNEVTCPGGDPVAAAYRAGYQHAEGIERIDALQQAAAARTRAEQAPGLAEPASPPEANLPAVQPSREATDLLYDIAQKMTNHDYEIDQELGLDG